jgi:hypothetical protein
MTIYAPGTRIEVASFSDNGTIWQPAKIARWTRSMGPRDSLPAGYEPVCFDADKAVLMVHATRFRVTDNRPAQ